jgi:hypothetical protein
LIEIVRPRLHHLARGFRLHHGAVRVEALDQPGYVGAIAFSRSGDPATGDFGDAKLIRRFGEVPDDLSAL